MDAMDAEWASTIPSHLLSANDMSVVDAILVTGDAPVPSRKRARSLETQMNDPDVDGGEIEDDADADADTGSRPMKRGRRSTVGGIEDAVDRVMSLTSNLLPEQEVRELVLYWEGDVDLALHDLFYRTKNMCDRNAQWKERLAKEAESSTVFHDRALIKMALSGDSLAMPPPPPSPNPVLVRNLLAEPLYPRPSTWTLHKSPAAAAAAAATTVKLDLDKKDDPEVQSIEKEILRRHGDDVRARLFPLVNVERVEVMSHYNRFRLAQGAIKASNNDYSCEKLLFHGTNGDHLDAILANGLDLRYAKPGACGTALYFSESIMTAAKYAADGFANSTKAETFVILLCRVEVGVPATREQLFKWTEARLKRPPQPYELRLPPPRHDLPGTHRHYDSVSYKLFDHGEHEAYAIYDASQVHIEYVLRFDPTELPFSLPAHLRPMPKVLTATKPAPAPAPAPAGSIQAQTEQRFRLAQLQQQQRVPPLQQPRPLGLLPAVSLVSQAVGSSSSSSSAKHAPAAATPLSVHQQEETRRNLQIKEANDRFMHRMLPQHPPSPANSVPGATPNTSASSATLWTLSCRGGSVSSSAILTKMGANGNFPSHPGTPQFPITVPPPPPPPPKTAEEQAAEDEQRRRECARPSSERYHSMWLEYKTKYGAAIDKMLAKPLNAKVHRDKIARAKLLFDNDPRDPIQRLVHDKFSKEGKVLINLIEQHIVKKILRNFPEYLEK